MMDSPPNRYIYANVQIPIEIKEHTHEYTPLKEYIKVTFHKCDEDPRQQEPTQSYLKESMAEIIKKIFEKNTEQKNTEQKDNDTEKAETVIDLLSILESELKQKKQSKNITFKNKPRYQLNKRTTAKLQPYIMNNMNHITEEEGAGF